MKGLITSQYVSMKLNVEHQLIKLKGLHIFSRFTAIFHKGDNFSDLVFVFCTSEGLLLNERICSP